MENALLQMGLPGIVILGLAFALKMLWGRYCDSQDFRIKEGRESVEALTANTHALDTLAELIKQKN